MNTFTNSHLIAWLIKIVSLLASVNVFATTINWQEDAVLHDGRVIAVSLQVSDRIYNASISILAPFYFKRTNLNIYRLEFRHPDTGQRIVWEGLPNFKPLLVDFVDSKPYLVVFGRPDKDTASIYGCPELPYIYLRYDGFDWKHVSVDQAPAELLNSNISTYLVWSGYEGRHLSAEEVAAGIENTERQSGGHVQGKIPRTYDEWRKENKDSDRNERLFGDCRPPPSGPQDVSIPIPLDVELQLVETIDIDDPTSFATSLRLKPSAQSRKNCDSVFRVADPYNRMLGRRFTNDPSGAKVVPYAGPSPFKDFRLVDTRTFTYCDGDYIWFVASKEEPGKIHITKYTYTGDFIYNVRFTAPRTVENDLYREMVIDTVKIEDGSFTFYWKHSLPTPPNQSKIYPTRFSKFRFIEPSPNASSN